MTIHPVRRRRIPLAGAALDHSPDHSPDCGPDHRSDYGPVLRQEQTPSGLHTLFDYAHHARWQRRELWVLPELDLGVTRFTPRPGVSAPLYYLDMLTVTQTPGAWITADLYLDVAVQTSGTPALLDSDEFAAALAAGHLTPGETTRALLSAERVINGLFEHRTLEAWLESLGVQLGWWTLHSPA